MRNITHLRNRDFIRQYFRSERSLRLRGFIPTPEEIVRHALAQPAPSYYVDYYRAIRRLTGSQKSKKPQKPARSYASSAQWRDMATDLRRIRRHRPTADVREIILDMCSGRAGFPRFYITPRRAMEIVQRSLF